MRQRPNAEAHRFERSLLASTTSLMTWPLAQCTRSPFVAHSLSVFCAFSSANDWRAARMS